MSSSEVVGLDEQNSLRDDVTAVENCIANFGHMQQQEQERKDEMVELQTVRQLRHRVWSISRASSELHTKTHARHVMCSAWCPC